MSLWAAIPVTLVLTPTLFGALPEPDGWMTTLRRTGTSWLFLGVGAIVFRSVQLFFQRDIETGLVWATKIVTDPFSDFKLYRHAPARLLRGERLDTREPA